MRVRQQPQSSSTSAPQSATVQPKPFSIETEATEPAPSQERPSLQPRQENTQSGFNFGQLSVFPRSSAIQAKLTVGAPNDSSEQEADRVAEQVMQMPGPDATSPVQRQTAPEDDELQMKAVDSSVIQRETEEDELQLKLESSERSTIQKQGRDGAVYDVNLASSSSGQALPEGTRAKMESSLGANFSDVRVHTDGQAEQFGALAFATGKDLHFAQGKYDPTSQHGQELIGHELAHVVQQQQGRVSAPAQAGGGNATIVQDPSLESEADALGSQAARSPEVRTPAVQTATTEVGANSTIQQKPMLQAWFPALGAGLSALGSALSSATAAQAATVAATAIGAGVQVNAGTSVQPGTSGVQPVQLDNGWMSNVDRQKLNLITQYRLINRYVEHWVRTHPEAMSPTPAPTSGTPSPTPAPAPTPTPTPAPAPTSATPTPAPTPTGPAGAATSGGQVDGAILTAVSAEVQLQLEQSLNTNQRAAADKEFIWSDSGDNTADWVGTVGAITFTGVQGTSLRETLELTGEAANIPNLDPPMRGTEMVITQFRGGRMIQSPQFSTGYGDDLAINLDGAGPTYDQAANSSHGTHTYSTAWRWDGNTTHLLIKIQIGENGTPSIEETGRQGSPKDYSGSRAMPWNWFG